MRVKTETWYFSQMPPNKRGGQPQSVESSGSAPERCAPTAKYPKAVKAAPAQYLREVLLRRTPKSSINCVIAGSCAPSCQ